MKRYLVLVTIAFMLGIIGEDILRLPVLSWLVLSGLAILVAAYYYCRKHYDSLPLILLCLCLLGAAWYSLSNYPGLKFQPLVGQNIVGQGYILTYPQVGSYQQTFLVKVEHLTVGDQHVMGLNKLLIKASLGSGENGLKPGDQVQFRGILKEPKKPTNPGQFDYRRYLANQQVFFEISCSAVGCKLISTGRSLRTLAAKGRTEVAEILSTILPTKEKALIMGLLFGDVSEMESREKMVYQQAGVSHLFAVSGFNVAFVLGILWFILNLFRPSPIIRLGLAIPILIGYYFLVGWSASIVRACLMAFLALVALALGRKNDIYTALASSALIILLISPGELFQIGFQLSFLITLGMVYLTPWLKKRGCGRYLAPALAAQLTGLPLVAYNFNLVSLLAPILNIFAALVSGFVTVLGMIGVVLTWTIPVIAKPIFLLCGFLMYCLSQAISWCAGLRWIAYVVPSPPFFMIILSYPILAILPYYRYYRYHLRLVALWRKLVLIIMLGLGIIISCWPRQSFLEVTFLDVGQGDCIMIRTPQDKRILLDGGGTPESDFPVGEKIVLPYLRKQGIGRLDAVIMSHNHLDHSEGLLELISLIPVNSYYLPPLERQNEMEQALLTACRQQNIPVKKLTAGQVLHLEDEIILEVLHPLSGDRTTGNNHSLVLRLVYGSCEWLLTGDVEKSGIGQIVSRGSEVHADLLKLPHHGSITSYHEGFYQKVKPQVVVVSAGSTYHNHPHPEIEEYFSERGILLYCTKKNGAIITSSDGKKMQIKPLKP